MNFHQTTRRLLSLDVFRGITIVGMTIVNSPGNGTAYAPLEHSEWNGCTPTDLVFPFFIFIVGVSLVFAFGNRREAGQGRSAVLFQILRRTLILFGLGLFLNGFPYYHLATLRISGVLQRIALCYFFASILYLFLRPRALAFVTGALFVGYGYAMMHMSVPGFGAGDLSPAGNLAAYVDQRWLPRPFYLPDLDPEGILSTLPAIATALIGVLTGVALRRAFLSDGPAQRRAVIGMTGAGITGLVAGLLWDRWFPINKSLWTSSFVLFTSGAALVLLAFCVWQIEIKGRTRWAQFFLVFGVNGIAAYVLPILTLKIQNRIPIANPDGSVGNLRLFITRHLFEGWATPPAASLLYALAHTLIWFFIFRALFRRRLFIKI